MKSSELLKVSSVSRPESNTEVTVVEMTPEFFLSSNTDRYYAWHLPPGKRSTLSFTRRGMELDGDVMVKIPPMTTIIGLSVTGYRVSPSQHNLASNTPLFVVDTLPSMNNPYSTEDYFPPHKMAPTTLEQFFEDYYDSGYGSYMGLYANSLYGMSLAEWGQRIDRVWALRLSHLPYPSVGLVFYSRDRDLVVVWRETNYSIADDGTVTPLPQFGYNVKVDGEVPTTTLSFGDIAGGTTTVPEWLLEKLLVNRLKQSSDSMVEVAGLAQYRVKHIARESGKEVKAASRGMPYATEDKTQRVWSYATEEDKEYVLGAMILSPRQQDWVASL